MTLPPIAFLESNMIVLFAGMIAIWIFIVVLPGRREKKRKAEMLDNLEKGAKVLVQAGFFGKVLQNKDSIVVLDCGGAKIEVLKNTIVRVVDNKNGDAKS